MASPRSLFLFRAALAAAMCTMCNGFGVHPRTMPAQASADQHSGVHRGRWATALAYKSESADGAMAGDVSDDINHDFIHLEPTAETPRTLDVEDPVLKIPELEKQLKALKIASPPVDGSEYDDAHAIEEMQRIQDELDHTRSMAEFGVRAAQLDFYQAFSDGDLELMTSIWGKDQPAAATTNMTAPATAAGDSKLSCIHPGMPSIEGRESILQSWKEIFQYQADNVSYNGKFTVQAGSGAKISICGITALCSCTEEITYRRMDKKGDGSESSTPIQKMEALNVYKREDGKWRMTMHMANPIIEI